MSVFIYALKDPDTGQIRYVGKTVNQKDRLRRHLSDSRKTHRVDWIKNLRLGNMQPVFVLLDEVPDSEWQQWEAAYIEYFRGLGCRLVNGTSGGEGVDAGEKHPNFGKTFSSSALAKMRAAILGRQCSSETREKIRISNVGKRRSLATREKISEARRGRKASPETRAKMSAAHQRRKNGNYASV